MQRRIGVSSLVISEKEVNEKEHQSCQRLEETRAQTFCRFLVQALITAKETLSREEFCESAVMPDFMMPGNSYLLSKEENISNPTKNSSILCQPAK